MGSVKRIRKSGDNDPQISEVDISENFMYCDECGSFKLTSWIDPPYDENREKQRKRMQVYVWIFLAAGVISMFLGRYLLFALCLLGLIGMQLYLSKMMPKLKWMGMECEDCGIQYPSDSEFFQNKYENPRNYTEEDIPTASENPYKFI